MTESVVLKHSYKTIGTFSSFEEAARCIPENFQPPNHEAFKHWFVPPHLQETNHYAIESQAGEVLATYHEVFYDGNYSEESMPHDVSVFQLKKNGAIISSGRSLADIMKLIPAEALPEHDWRHVPTPEGKARVQLGFNHKEMTLFTVVGKHLDMRGSRPLTTLEGWYALDPALPAPPLKLAIDFWDLVKDIPKAMRVFENPSLEGLKKVELDFISMGMINYLDSPSQGGVTIMGAAHKKYHKGMKAWYQEVANQASFLRDKQFLQDDLIVYESNEKMVKQMKLSHFEEFASSSKQLIELAREAGIPSHWVHSSSQIPGAITQDPMNWFELSHRLRQRMFPPQPQ